MRSPDRKPAVDTPADQVADAYAATLDDYCRTHSEAALYEASAFSRACIRAGIGPDEIIALHSEAVSRVVSRMAYREQARASADALHFLLEIMITYGIQHREYLELRDREAARASREREADERRRRDQQDSRVEQAERGEQLKAEALAMIAHELRTPITAAMGNLDLALRALDRGNPASAERLMHGAREAMERLSRLTADLVDASRGDLPRFDPVRLDLVAVVDQSFAWGQVSAAEKGVTLIRAPGPPSVFVLGDADALMTAFGNLLSNAIRYTPAGESVTVRLWVDGGWAWVEVQDRGIGMSAETQSRIFEQFFRAAEAQVIEQQGLGLGLSLTNRIVLAHRGTVTVESTPDVGSSFRVQLPLASIE